MPFESWSHRPSSVHRIRSVLQKLAQRASAAVLHHQSASICVHSDAVQQDDAWMMQCCHHIHFALCCCNQITISASALMNLPATVSPSTSSFTLRRMRLAPATLRHTARSTKPFACLRSLDLNDSNICLYFSISFCFTLQSEARSTLCTGETKPQRAERNSEND
jgi:hypothetical protein